MTHLRCLLAFAAITLPTAPALAAGAAAASSVRQAAPPSVLSELERSAYRAVFDAIRAEDWAAAAAKLDSMGDGPLHAVARAEIYLAKGSPKVELEPLLALVAIAPDMPKAGQLARLAISRGAIEAPVFTQPQKLFWGGGQPRRSRAKSVKGDAIAIELEALIQPLIKDNQPAAAESLVAEREYVLTPEALTEYQQRVAWSHYISGRYADARRLAEKARSGRGEWALQAEWLTGLAAWRLGDCEAAGASFATVAARATDAELAAAGHYWAARADMMCARPERVQARLRSATRAKETFYGLLAARALGISKQDPSELHDYRDAEWKGIAAKPNVRAAIALNELGERALADEMISHQAKIGSASEHEALLHLASDLNLPGTQFWLAHNVPQGARVNMAARYPMPNWRPASGWRVDQSLAYAHALQESNFRTQVVSPAGAHGLMQVRPGTAGDMARSRGEAFDPSQLSDPAFNLEYGQRYLEYLRDNGGTSGLLPKVIAAYNAGLVPVGEWNARGIDDGDPLLYIESIPYWETRGYVPTVLRNYWIYEQQAGKDSATRDALVQGLWPRFPGLPGAKAVRLERRSLMPAAVEGSQ
ncbi:MAG: lytic transglycosylase domain-containing protein [Pseudomonadota bacterium]|nr:lytic transglycosylase domain-containing protein [Pseudomonadota bacterium]